MGTTTMKINTKPLYRVLFAALAGVAVSAVASEVGGIEPSPDPVALCPANPSSPPSGTIVGHGCSSQCTLTHGCCQYITYRLSNGSVVNWHKCEVVAQCANIPGVPNSTTCRNEGGDPIRPDLPGLEQATLP